MNEFQLKVQRQIWADAYDSVSQKVARKKERGREICNSSVASHRWWVEVSSGAPKLARIKGGFKTSAEHQSSNQGTAATMRAFMVSSPRRFLVSPISHFLLLSPPRPSRSFCFLPVAFLFGFSSLFLSSRVRGRFLGGW